MLDYLEKAPDDVDHVVVRSDGSFTFEELESRPPGSTRTSSNVVVVDDVIDVSSDEEGEEEERKPDMKRRRVERVDSEEEPSLYRRLEYNRNPTPE